MKKIAYHIHLMTISAVFFLLLFSLSVSGQSVIRFEPSVATSRESVYRSHFSKYALGSIDVAHVSNMLRSTGHFDTLTIIADGKSYKFSLEARDVRAGNYKLLAQSESGIEEMPLSPNMTYTGTTWDGELPVCITADDHFFTAMIMSSEGALFIESAKLVDPSATEEQFVIYNEKNLINSFENSLCGTTAPSGLYTETKQTQDGSRSGSLPCRTIEIAIADDYSMFTKYGSNVYNVQLQNLAVINLVNTNYDFEFNFPYWFNVTTIHVHTSASGSPWYTGTDYVLLLNSFTAWAPTGFTVAHDAGSLWTNRDLNDGVVGLAWVDQVCDSSYNILQDFSPNYAFLRVLQTHELGHNFGWGHDPYDGYIMSPSISNTNIWSTESRNFINPRLDTASCIGFCQSATGARVGIGTTSPHATAALDITSNSKGLLIPRLTPLQREGIYSPAEGLLVYDVGSKSFWFNNSTDWIEILDGATFKILPNNNMFFAQAGNIAIGNVEDPLNKIDIATEARGNLYTGAHPSNLPIYVTGSGPDYKGLEIRNSYADQGIGISPTNIYATSWTPNHSFGLSAKGPTGSLKFTTDALERMRITGAGNVGIGTIAPHASAALEVASTSKGVLISRMNTTERTAIVNPQTGLLVFDITTNSFWFRGALNWVELVDNLDTEVFRNGPDKLYMGLTDSVGIGTTNPAYKLEVKTGNNQYGISHRGGGVEIATWSGLGGEIGTVSNHSFSLYANNGINQFTLLPNGNVGIGTYTPHAQLQLGTSVANRKLVIYEGANNDNEFHGFGINADGALRYQTSHFLNDHVFYSATNSSTSLELMRIKGENGDLMLTGIVQPEAFIAPTLLNNFSNYEAGFAPAAYYKDKSGRVNLRGLIKNTGNPVGLVVFTLPVGYRPSTSGKLVFMTISNNAVGRIDIHPNGNVVVDQGTATWISLEGISFRPD